MYSNIFERHFCAGDIFVLATFLCWRQFFAATIWQATIFRRQFFARQFFGRHFTLEPILPLCGAFERHSLIVSKL
jgi:hypothetical protein